MKRLLALLVIAVLLSACGPSGPGVVETFCDGFTEGVASGNSVAQGMGLPGPLDLECPEDGIEVLPDDPTPAQVWCYGRLNGFVTVGKYHFPDDAPTPGWISNYLSACNAYKEDIEEDG